jgi:hypothetical protein
MRTSHLRVVTFSFRQYIFGKSARPRKGSASIKFKDVFVCVSVNHSQPFGVGGKEVASERLILVVESALFGHRDYQVFLVASWGIGPCQAGSKSELARFEIG